MNKVKVAVIGYGHLGKWHCQKASEISSCEFVGIVEMSAQGREAAAKNHPDVMIVDDIAKIEKLVDAFIIVTPTSTHSSLVSNLLNKDKHVFCEKPLCSNSKELELIASSMNDKLILQVGHSERCHQIWEKLKPEFLQMQEKFILKLSRFAPFKGRAVDVDVISDLMIHDIDLMLYLMNKQPTSVRSFGFKIRTAKYDHIVSHFYFNDGSICEITAGRNSTHEVREFELMNSAGCYRVDLMNNTYSYAPATQVSEGVYVRSENYEKRDHLKIEQTYFYDSILNNKPIFVDFHAGEAALKLMDAIAHSLETSSEVNL